VLSSRGGGEPGISNVKKEGGRGKTRELEKRPGNSKAAQTQKTKERKHLASNCFGEKRETGQYRN